MVVIDEIQGVYEANYQRHHPGAPMPPRVPDETLAQILRRSLRVEYVSVEGEPHLVANELKSLRDKVDELFQRVRTLEFQGEPKPPPEPKRMGPWVDMSPEGWGREVTLRWPDRYSVKMRLLGTPQRIRFDGLMFDRVDDPATGESLDLYVARTNDDEER